MLAYKGFDSNLKCLDFQYEIGGEYECDKARLCEFGFHACLDPAHVLTYYAPINSRYCLVDLDNIVDEKSSDTKICGTKIKIIKEFSQSEFIQECFSWLKANILSYSRQTSRNGAHSLTCGLGAQSQTSGYMAHSQTSGYRARSQTSGNDAHSQTSGLAAYSQTSGDQAHSQTSGNEGYSQTCGYKSHSQTSGSDAHSQTCGYESHSQTYGDCAHSQTSGECANSQTSGNMAHAQACGKKSQAIASGKNSIACSLGICSAAKAAGECDYIVLAEYDGESNLIDVRVGKVGIDIERDKFYILENGKFIKVQMSCA